MIKFDSKEEAKQAMHLAIGRLWKLMNSAPAPTDVQQYEDCRAVVMAASEYIKGAPDTSVTGKLFDFRSPDYSQFD